MNMIDHQNKLIQKYGGNQMNLKQTANSITYDARDHPSSPLIYNVAEPYVGSSFQGPALTNQKVQMYAKPPVKII